MHGNIFGQFLDTSPDRVKTGPDIPFKRIGSIKPRQVNEIESSYSSTLKLRQGENGAPSGYCPGFALSKYYWTKISQAKWDTVECWEIWEGT